MKRIEILTGLVVLCLASLLATPAVAQETTEVALETSKGTIVLELYPDKAPKTVANFVAYVESGYYDGTVFHRVIPGFMIQGGGFTSDMTKKETGDPIQNESKNGLSNQRGTISMARTSDPHSATAQFFINSVDNAGGLDYGNTGQTWGYTVFGKVSEGMDVVDAISGVKTGTGPGGMRDVPTEPVVIQKATVR